MKDSTFIYMASVHSSPLSFGFSEESDEDYMSRLIEEWDRSDSCCPPARPRRSQRLKELGTGAKLTLIPDPPQCRDILPRKRR
jgi:hypothetical protein